jgi:hypothetical protein
VGAVGWQTLSSRLHADASNRVALSVVSESIEAQGHSTAYMARLVIAVGSNTMHLVIYARYQDVLHRRGCELDIATTGQASLTYVGPTNTAGSNGLLAPLADPLNLLMIVQIVPNGAQDAIQCFAIGKAGTGSAAPGIDLAANGADNDLPDGLFAIQIDNWAADLQGLEILDE